ncbi:MAG: 30S ribosomal protein S9 [Methylacidiphilales bacterium]|nr:30S ribosomal protein S9 [Candidatus Methylacidiphilales bacterium]MDW8349199.1 30S ribosomal protein S9 [Verrucomicrobiae bacterium]
MNATSSYIETVGRRKTAVVIARVKPGTGIITVNKRPFEEYFPTLNMQLEALKSLQATDSIRKFDIEARAEGGGLQGQAGAFKLATARALVKINSENKAILRKIGALTRDPRAKERKKSGQPGARKRFQFSKR